MRALQEKEERELAKLGKPKDTKVTRAMIDEQREKERREKEQAERRKQKEESEIPLEVRSVSLAAVMRFLLHTRIPTHHTLRTRSNSCNTLTIKIRKMLITCLSNNDNCTNKMTMLANLLKLGLWKTLLLNYP